MTAFDYAVLGVIAVSLLLGVWRGVVSEVLALAAWVVGFLVAREYAADVAPAYGKLITDASLRYVAGFATIVVATLIVFALGRLLLRLLLRAIGLGFADRMLGMVFGVARGVLIALLGVALGGMTALPKEKWWREAWLAPPMETAVIASKPWLPPEAAKRIRYR